MIYPMKQVRITAPFGYYTVFGSRSMHYAIDIAAAEDRRVFASHGGEVIMSLFDPAGGNMVAVRGPFCRGVDVITRYAHLDSRLVEQGQQLQQGQQIGVQGNTGSATTGRHLHFETWLLPEGEPYSYSLREKYALDPLGLLEKPEDCVFEQNGKTSYQPIPHPQPSAPLVWLPAGCKMQVGDGVELRLVPDLDTSPIVGGEGRCRDSITRHFPSQSEYDCILQSEMDGRLWYGLVTQWDMLWCLFDPEKMRLIRPEGGGEQQPGEETPEQPPDTEPGGEDTPDTEPGGIQTPEQGQPSEEGGHCPGGCLPALAAALAALFKKELM